MCSSVGRAAISKVAGRGFESLRTRYAGGEVMARFWGAGAIKKQTEGGSTVLNHLNEFFTNLKMEMVKVEWTDYEKLVSYTKLVLLFIFVSGMSIYFVDLCIKGALDLVKLLLRRVFG